MGGGARHFMPKEAGGARADGGGSARNSSRRATRASRTALMSGAAARAEAAGAAPRPVPSVAPAGRLRQGGRRPLQRRAGAAGQRAVPRHADARGHDAAGPRSLAAHSPDGFYLMVEGASIDKRAHAVDADRTIWDTIEFDRAVQVALDFARRTNSDDDPDNDTLVIVTADHECGGWGSSASATSGTRRQTIGRAVRDYAAVFRFAPEQVLDFVPELRRGRPRLPRRSGSVAQAAARLGRGPGPPRELAVEPPPARSRGEPGRRGVANPARDGPTAPIPGFVVTGAIENGATGCPAQDGCPADTVASSLTISGHTATDVPCRRAAPAPGSSPASTRTPTCSEDLLRARRSQPGGIRGGWPS
jgi:hypothetical protein